MTLQYVLKNFSRRKVRTILMVLSLVVSTGLIVTMSATVATLRQSNVDLVVSDVGRADLVVSKKDTSSDLYMPISEMAALMLAADNRITGVHPRIEIAVEFPVNGRAVRGRLVGLESSSDDIGTVEVKEGAYVPGNYQVAVFEAMAREFGLSVGDVITVAYTPPRRRQEGKAAKAGQHRIRQQFAISAIIVQNGITGAHNGMLVELADLQTMLRRPAHALQMLATVDAALYQSNNADVAALQVRDVTRAVQRRLNDDYEFKLDKAATLSEVSQLFQAAQALINTYGLISLGVVGLLVHTLVMTNVQEQRRDMAVLRILGAQRNLLFQLVIVEVVLIGLIGVGLGVLLGQALTSYVVVPLMVSQMANDGVTTRLTPQVTLEGILPAVLSAFTVLILSGVKPAREASRTKVMYAINPGVADNIQLEDLTQLRERRPDGKIFLVGAALMFIFGLGISSDLLATFGGPGIAVMLALVWLILLVLGLSMMFFITTVPFERLILSIMRFINPRLTYFAERNVSRGKTRNTLIAMLVLFSGVLPSFLATQAQMDNANFENRTRLSMGAPVRIDAFSVLMKSGEFENLSLTLSQAQEKRLKPRFVQDQLASVPGFYHYASLSYPYVSTVRDSVGLRTAPVEVIGVTGSLAHTLFADMTEFRGGDAQALQTILSDPQAVIISEGLASFMAVGLGEVIELQGAGLDNMSKVRVVAIARRLPGISGIGRSRTLAESGSTVLVSMAHFERLITELDKRLPTPDDALIETLFATMQPDADPEAVAEGLSERFSERQPFSTRFFATELAENKNEQAAQQTFLLVLTGISFTTAVFGVFAVIYVTIYARRIEIGMLKAMGMLRHELIAMLILESIAMTLGSALAGIAAGASLGYISFYSQNILQQIPIRFAIDTTVMPAIIILVIVASMLGAFFSARRIVRKRAVDILRM